jgi:hypothetical protein
MGQPDYDLILLGWWGGAWECAGDLVLVGSASNVFTGTNPPYTLNDFLGSMPGFAGTVSVQAGSVTQGSATITGLTNASQYSPGQLIAGADISSATLITAIPDNTSLTISNPALNTNAAETLMIYTSPAIPLSLLQMYINLASSSLIQARWHNDWYAAMGWFVAHYVTLVLNAGQSGKSTAGQAATAGLAMAIKTSKSVDQVSAGYTPIGGLENWGAYQLTVWGQLLATRAQVVGFGAMYAQ